MTYIDHEFKGNKRVKTNITIAQDSLLSISFSELNL